MEEEEEEEIQHPIHLHFHPTLLQPLLSREEELNRTVDYHPTLREPTRLERDGKEMNQIKNPILLHDLIPLLTTNLPILHLSSYPPLYKMQSLHSQTQGNVQMVEEEDWQIKELEAKIRRPYQNRLEINL